MANTRTEIVTVLATDDLLKKIIALWRQESATLGFMPEGAFEEHANKKHLLAAIDKDRNVSGYLLYRIAKNRAIIAHLCIAPPSRGQGIAKLLVEELSTITRKAGLPGIGLSCRRDFEVSSMWPKLGFTARSERLGRGIEPGLLTYWWRDNNIPSLFSIACEPSTKLKAVIDANVFFDCYGVGDRDSEESKSLLADWISNEIELVVTDELYNEIQRNQNSEARQKYRILLDGFPKCQTTPESCDSQLNVLRSLLKKPDGDSDNSDARQLAHTLAAGIGIFITRDGGLLKQRDVISEKTGLKIKSPAEIITEIDLLLRDQEYQPARLKGSSLTSRRATIQDEQLIIETFQGMLLGESAADLRRKLCLAFSKPDVAEVKIVNDENKTIQSVEIWNTQSEEIIEISLLRVSKQSIRSTLRRHLLQRAVHHAASNEIRRLVFTDTPEDDSAQESLRELGFRHDGESWKRDVIKLAGPLKQCLTVLKNTALGGTPFLNIPDEDCHISFELEKFFWPMKILDSSIPTFIIPIRPGWAERLFDAGLAENNLWGSDPVLMLNLEHVYYRSAKIFGLSAPGRILWYISKSSDTPNQTMQIRACSHLDEITIDRPKNLFRRFKRLGVYSWEDVFSTADNELHNDVMALRFTGTELFQNPVPFETLGKLGINGNIQSPRKISNEQFETIYRMGAFS